GRAGPREPARGTDRIREPSREDGVLRPPSAREHEGRAMNEGAIDVWIVDDDQSVRWVLEKALKQAGMQPRSFERAEHLLEAIERTRPDVLITDVRMPGMSGLALLTQLRRDHPNLPVIVMTAHSDLDNA